MSASRFVYPARLTPARHAAPDEAGFIVTFRDLPEAITQGEDVADALAQAADCLEEAIAARIKTGDDIPIPSRVSRTEKPVALPARTAAKAALYLAMREAGISETELAGRLGCHEEDVRRLFARGHGSRLPDIEAALAALGKRLELVVRDTA